MVYKLDNYNSVAFCSPAKQLTFSGLMENSLVGKQLLTSYHPSKMHQRQSHTRKQHLEHVWNRDQLLETVWNMYPTQTIHCNTLSTYSPQLIGPTERCRMTNSLLGGTVPLVSKGSPLEGQQETKTTTTHILWVGSHLRAGLQEHNSRATNNNSKKDTFPPLDKTCRGAQKPGLQCAVRKLPQSQSALRADAVVAQVQISQRPRAFRTRRTREFRFGPTENK